MKSPRRQLEEEYEFLGKFIVHESRAPRPCRKLLDLLYDLRFALAVKIKKLKWKF